MKKNLIFVLILLKFFSIYAQNTGIGITTPVSRLHINGTSWFQGDNTPLPVSAGKGIAIGYGGVGYIYCYDYFNNLSKDLILQHTGGNLGIGTTAPQGKVHIDASSVPNSEALRLSGAQPFISFFNGTSPTGYIWSKNTGDFDFGTSSSNVSGKLSLSILGNPKLTLYQDGRFAFNGPRSNGFAWVTFNGNVSLKGDGEWKMEPINQHLWYFYNDVFKSWIDWSDGSWNTVSDIRLKTDIKPFKSVLKDLSSLQIVSYNFKSNPEQKCFGLLAQNVKQNFPEIVKESGIKNGVNLLGIDYSKTGVIAIKAIQEQQIIIEDLKTQIELLQKAIVDLQQKLK